jgi:serine/threonine-protein kinase HipA
MSNPTVLEILLHGGRIGTLTRFDNDRSLFAFDQAYVSDLNRATLSLSFKRSDGTLLADTRPTQRRVLPFFANLLPEGDMRRYLAERAGVHPEREFFLLWALGQDLAGAVTVRPLDGDLFPYELAAGVKNRTRRHDAALRFSLAGVQLKFSAVAAATGGLTIPTNGTGGAWIAKLPSQKFPRVPQNEFAMMSMARAVGIDVPEIRLVKTADIDGLPDGLGRLESLAYAIRRFDRLPDGKTLHIEDFAQVFRIYPEAKYEKANYANIAAVIAAEAGAPAVGEFVRRVVFNVLIGNGDMHLKNWSLIYPDRRTAMLSPAYDFVSTIPYIKNDKLGLNVATTKEFDQVTEAEFMAFAKKAKLPQAQTLATVKDTVERFNEVWRKQKSTFDLQKTTIEAIEANLKRVPIAKGV